MTKLILGLFSITYASLFGKLDDLFTTTPAPLRNANAAAIYNMIPEKLSNPSSDTNQASSYGPKVHEPTDPNAPTPPPGQERSGNGLNMIDVQSVLDIVHNVQVSALELQSFRICVKEYNKQASEETKAEQMNEIKQWLASDWSKFGQYLCGGEFKCWKNYLFAQKNRIIPKSHRMIKKCLKKRILV